MTRKQVLDRMRVDHLSAWTELDVAPVDSRPFETKWENGASRERQVMVEDGLLENGGDGHWVLTADGYAVARRQSEQLSLIGDLEVDNRGYADLRAGQLLLQIDEADATDVESSLLVPVGQVDPLGGFRESIDDSGQTAGSTGPSEETLGAWVLKCNPAVWDLAEFLAAGERVIYDWTVQENRRSEMIRHEQRVLLWVTGAADGSLPRGFWGSGWTTGPVAAIAEVGADDEPTDVDVVDYWLDLDVRDRMRFVAPLELTVWDTPLAEAQVVEVLGPERLEVIRARQMSNPSWISATDLALLEPLLPPWPTAGAPADELITVDAVTGAGYGDPTTNQLVEIAAVDAVTEYYRARGYAVKSVEREKCGWDLTCTAANGDVARVEVKGTAGAKPVVLLTRNEHRSATEEAGWVLAVVTRAATHPTVSIYEPVDVLAVAEPYVYRLNLIG